MFQNCMLDDNMETVESAGLVNNMVVCIVMGVELNLHGCRQ